VGARRKDLSTTASLDKPYWEENIASLAQKGYRVLAVAFKETDLSGIAPEDVSSDMVLLGCVGMVDPPRPEAIQAIQECRRAGIRVKMITGDHALTARSIGAQMGIGDGARRSPVVSLEQMSDEALCDAVLVHDVFARSSPEHKLRLVMALQSHGEVVAMTGDGVNDAPALKRADVGVAMGIKGSEASKSAAAMVLADDNFASIEHAIEEGRTIYDNLKKTILFLLPTNGAEALIVLATVVVRLQPAAHNTCPDSVGQHDYGRDTGPGPGIRAFRSRADEPTAPGSQRTDSNQIAAVAHWFCLPGRGRIRLDTVLLRTENRHGDRIRTHDCRECAGGRATFLLVQQPFHHAIIPVPQSHFQQSGCSCRRVPAGASFNFFLPIGGLFNSGSARRTSGWWTGSGLSGRGWWCFFWWNWRRRSCAACRQAKKPGSPLETLRTAGFTHLFILLHLVDHGLDHE
jgi:soluble P-type ATPase